MISAFLLLGKIKVEVLLVLGEERGRKRGEVEVEAGAEVEVEVLLLLGAERGRVRED